MIKRFVVSTLVALILAVLLAGGFIGYTLYEIQGLVNEVEELEQAFRQTNEDFAHDDWTSATLDLKRFEAFLRVRRNVGEQLGRGMRDMLVDLARKEERARSGEQVGILAIMRTLRGHFREQRAIAMGLARELERERMSAREYRDWTMLLFESVRARADSAPECGELWERYRMAERFLLLFTSGLSPGRRGRSTFAESPGIIDHLLPDPTRGAGDGGDDASPDSRDTSATGDADLPQPFTILDRDARFVELHAALPDVVFEELWREQIEVATPLVAPFPGAGAPQLGHAEPAADGAGAPDAAQHTAIGEAAITERVEIPMWALLDLIVLETRDEVLLISPSTAVGSSTSAAAPAPSAPR
jgi:hypothetical protein